MSKGTAGIPLDVPPSVSRSAHDYSTRCSFLALHSPNIELIVRMLQNHRDYVGFEDKIALLSASCRDQLVSIHFWDPFAKKVIVGIKVCITEDSKELGKIKKQLTLMGRVVAHEFASTHAGYFVSNDFGEDLCKVLLNVLGSVFITLLKHDMC